MSTFNDFKYNRLYPELIERIDTAFPGRAWTRKGGKWSSPYHLDGSESHSGAKERTYINTTGAYPYRVATTDDEGALSLIDYALVYRGYSPDSCTPEQFKETLQGLCSACGLELPQVDSQQYRQDRQREEKVAELYKQMKAALFKPEGAATLSYLQNERGYSTDEIKAMGLGFISSELADSINAEKLCLSYNPTRNKDIESGQAQSLPYYVGKTHTLAIPYLSGGVVRGFKFRCLGGTPTTKSGKSLDKYLNNVGLPKKAHLFGLSGLRLTGNKDKDKDLTIVEGELDALHARAIGIDNIVAAAGGVVSTEALQEAKSKGVKRVTILFDTEDTDEGNTNTNNKRKKAIETAFSVGLTPFVAVLPTDGGKQDPDSFLKTHSKEDLQNIIDNAPSAALFLFFLITEQARSKTTENGACTYKNLDEYKTETIRLANSAYVSATDRDSIFKEFSTCTGEYISKEALQEEADAQKKIEKLAEQSSKTLATATEAFQLAKDGKIQEAIALMGERAPELRALSLESEYSQLLALPTANNILARLSSKPEGITTAYSFGQGDKTERLVIPSGAITFVCAPTSHGKSKMLQNLALQMTQDSTTEGAVLYFTYEEDSESVIEQMENNYIGEYLSRNNLRTIRSLHTTGQCYFSRDSQLTLAHFQQREAQFFSLLSSGRLRIFYKDYDSNALIGAIKYIAKQIKVKAVFIDYVQLLHINGCKLQRTEEVKEICKKFKALAVDSGLPVVMAAQLNRETKSPIEMDSQNISEASDIEKIANTIICLWNSSFTPLVKSEWESRDCLSNGKPVKKSTEQNRIEGLGFEIGKGGKMYCKLTKNRGGERGLDSVLTFDGNTGRIFGNYSIHEPTQQSFISNDDAI